MARAAERPPLRLVVRAGLQHRSGWTSLVVVAIGIVSAVAAFAAVRVWFAPVGAAAVVRATLSVDTQPPGAELSIDERPRGATPASLAIDPGEHSLVVHAAGVERRVKVTLAPGAQVAQYFDLTANPPAAAPGRLSIVTDPPGARIVVDGKPRGLSPLIIDGLSAAQHAVTASSDAGSAERSVAVANDVTTEVVFSLPRSTAPVAGWIAVSSPFPVDILEQDEVVGTSGTSRIMLAAGKHELELRNESVGYTASRTVDVSAGSVAAVDVVPPQAIVNVNARPWADVSIDGVAAGQTPLANVALAIGPHEFTFRHPQLGERTERVMITASGVNRVAVDLTK
jgi:serine/threonine-protein kinase